MIAMLYCLQGDDLIRATGSCIRAQDELQALFNYLYNKTYKGK